MCRHDHQEAYKSTTSLTATTSVQRRAPLRMCKRVLHKIECHLMATDDVKHNFTQIHTYFIWSHRLKNTGSCWLMWACVTTLQYLQGCRDSTVVLTSHQCGPGSIARSGIKCELSLLLLYFAPSGFPSPPKNKI